MTLFTTKIPRGRAATKEPEPEELTAKGAKSTKKEIGISLAKHVLSNVEGALRRKGDGPGSSSRENSRDLRKISPVGRNDKDSPPSELGALARGISEQDLLDLRKFCSMVVRMKR